MKLFLKIAAIFCVLQLSIKPSFAVNTQNKNTISVTGMPPLMIFVYNFGAGYDYFVINTNEQWSISAYVTTKYGYSAGVGSSTKPASTSRCFRSDIGLKAWWNIHVGESQIGFFLGFSAAYAQENDTLATYKTSTSSPSVEIGSQVFNRILPGYTFGGVFRLGSEGRWSFGMAFSGLINNSVSMAYQLPNDANLQNIDIGIGRSLFMELSIGYSF